MDDRVGGLPTVRVVDPTIVPDVAEIVVVPAATAVASPVELIVAIAVSDELQETELLISLVLPSV